MSKSYSLLLFVLLSTSVVAGNNLVNLVMANPNVLPFIVIKSDGSVEPETRFITQNGSVYTLGYNLSRKYAVIIQCSNIVFDGAGHIINGSNPNWISYFNTGLSLESVTNVTVKDLEVSGFSGMHISIENSSHCVIHRVTAATFDFHESDFNTITESNNLGDIYVFMNQSNNNIIAKNKIDRVKLLGSTSNTFFENNFATTFRSQATVHSQVNSANFWDNGSTGNYWINYNGIDADGDGIGDTPYIINEENQDNYPLMEPTFIPEFPSWPLLGLGFFAVTVVLIIYRIDLKRGMKKLRNSKQ